MSHYGLGPWYVALLSHDSKNKTEIRCHTYAYEYASIHQALNEKNDWITLMLVGPFEKQHDAVWFTSEWSSKSARNKQFRLKRGQSLFNQHADRFKIKCWKNKMQRRLSFPKRKKSMSSLPLLTSNDAIDIAQISSMQKNLKKK